MKSKQTSLENFSLKPHHAEMGDEKPIIQDQEAESESSVQTVHYENESKSTDSSKPIKTILTIERLKLLLLQYCCYFSKFWRY